MTAEEAGVTAVEDSMATDEMSVDDASVI